MHELVSVQGQKLYSMEVPVTLLKKFLFVYVRYPKAVRSSITVSKRVSFPKVRSFIYSCEDVITTFLSYEIINR